MKVLVFTLLLLVPACAFFQSEDMTPEEKMAMAVTVAQEALAVFDEDSFDAEDWPAIEPYHRGATLALEAMAAALLADDPDAFEAARSGFWVALREILKHQRANQPSD